MSSSHQHREKKTDVSNPHTDFKYGSAVLRLKVARPLVAGYSTARISLPLHVVRWDELK